MYSYASLKLFTLLLFLFASASCKNKSTQQSVCKTNPGSCKSILEAKRFFLFKEGSWWVYEEETSHERDSVYVYEHYDSGGYDFDMRVRSALTGYQYHYYPFYAGGSKNCSKTSNVQGKCLLVTRSKGKPGDHMGESKVFFVNYKIGDYIFTGNGIGICNHNRIKVENIHHSYQLPVLQFSDVVEIKEDCSFLEGDQPTIHYYSPGVGLIRKEFKDSNQSWNLVEYYIAP